MDLDFGEKHHIHCYVELSPYKLAPAVNNIFANGVGQKNQVDQVKLEKKVLRLLPPTMSSILRPRILILNS